MIKEILVINEFGIKETVYLKSLDLTYIDKIMELQKHIVDNIDDKELYGTTEQEDFIEIINKYGIILGCVNKNDELVAMGAYTRYGYNEHNYGYDLDIIGDKLLSIGQIESTVVNIAYRGNKLQKIICEELEVLAREDNMEIISATVAPNNPFSLNTFLQLDYKIYTEKLKYGGLLRYILFKKL